MKKFAKFITMSAMIATLCATGFCTVYAEDESTVIEQKLYEDLDVYSVDKLRGPQYHYKAEYLPYTYKKVGGFAGNQVEGGYRFQTGGGFYFSDAGGPTASVQVSLSLPAPFNIVTVSASLGNNASSGQFVTVPDTQHYYKLYVEKTLEIHPFKVYRARAGSNNWEYDHSGYTTSVYSVNAYAKMVR